MAEARSQPGDWMAADRAGSLPVYPVTWTMPSMWPAEVTAPGFAWQDVQSSGAENPWVPSTWDWWAPTPTKLLAVLPERSRGGAAFVDPWQEVHRTLQSPLPALS